MGGTTNARVKTKKKYEYACVNCDHRVHVTSVIHNKIMRGYTYFSKCCGKGKGALKFVAFPGGQRVIRQPVPVIHLNDYRTAAETAAPALKPKPMPIGNKAIAKAIMMKYGYHLTRGQFIVRAVSAGLKATTASTYYNQLKRNPS